MMEEHEHAEIRPRIIYQKKNIENLLYLQNALNEREIYSTIDVYEY